MQISGPDSSGAQYQVHFSSSEFKDEQAQEVNREIRAEEETIKEIKKQDAQVQKDEQASLNSHNNDTEASPQTKKGQQRTAGSVIITLTQEPVSAKDKHKVLERLAEEKAEKTQFFNSSGQLTDPKKSTNTIDVFG